jgi:aspartyl-tRNA(Asn)/glutamyl-tRNA(Gln) amidotransferase subunit C
VLWKYPEMTLKSDDVRSIAHLARLHIEENAVDHYVDDLSSILALVEQMNQVDSEGVVPLSNPLDARQRLRADEVSESDQRDKFQAIAPDVAEGLYRVPRVIE